jgi:hypothetical protein
MYSYEKFLENHETNDLNIFVVTSPDRTYVKALDGILVFGEEWINYEVKRLNKITWYPSKSKHLRILESLRVYLNDWVDWEMNEHVQHVLVNNLWNINTNTMVIPAFYNSIEQSKDGLNECAFQELKMINPELGNTMPIGKTFDGKTVQCKRRCHFSPENNRIIYNLVANGINTGEKIVTLRQDQLVKPKIEDYFYYVDVIDYYQF